MIAQTPTSHRDHHRPLEDRPPDESLPPERLTGRQSARGAVRCGLQSPVAAAHDHQKGHRPFFAAANGNWFDRFAVQITPDLDRKSDQLRIDELANGLKVNFSGSTM